MLCNVTPKLRNKINNKLQKITLKKINDNIAPKVF